MCSVLPALLLLVLCLAGEGLLRVAAPDLRYAHASPLDPRRGYGVTLGHRFSLNSLSMREVEVTVPPPEGQYRVLCLGDSITFGYGLAAESAWPKLLEKRLQQDRNQPNVFCINAAGNASTPHEALAFYEAAARRFGAAGAVLGFCMNDVRLRQFPNDMVAASAGSRASQWLAWRYECRRSFLFAGLDLAVTEGFKRYVLPALGKTWLDAHPYQLNSLGMTALSEEAWRDTLDSLARLDDALRRDGVRFTIAAFPYQFQLSDDPRDNPYRLDKRRIQVDPFRRLRAFCRDRNITFVDLGTVFAKTRAEMIAGERAWDDLFLDYCHPNRSGQLLAAEVIAAHLGRLPDGLAENPALRHGPAHTAGADQGGISATGL